MDSGSIDAASVMVDIDFNSPAVYADFSGSTVGVLRGVIKEGVSVVILHDQNTSARFRAPYLINLIKARG